MSLYYTINFKREWNQNQTSISEKISMKTIQNIFTHVQMNLLVITHAKQISNQIHFVQETQKDPFVGHVMSLIILMVKYVQNVMRGIHIISLQVNVNLIVMRLQKTVRRTLTPLPLHVQFIVGMGMLKKNARRYVIKNVI